MKSSGTSTGIHCYQRSARHSKHPDGIVDIAIGTSLSLALGSSSSIYGQIFEQVSTHALFWGGVLDNNGSPCVARLSESCLSGLKVAPISLIVFIRRSRISGKGRQYPNLHRRRKIRDVSQFNTVQVLLKNIHCITCRISVRMSFLRVWEMP